MVDFEKPNIIIEQSDDGRHGRYVVEPLERGYGTEKCLSPFFNLSYLRLIIVICITNFKIFAWIFIYLSNRFNYFIYVLTMGYIAVIIIEYTLLQHFHTSSLL